MYRSSFGTFLGLFIVVACGETSFDAASPRRAAKEEPRNQGSDDAQDGQGDAGDAGATPEKPDSGDQTAGPTVGGSVSDDGGNGEGEGSKPGNLQTDDGNVNDKCDVPKGTPQPKVRLGGEDVPGNGFVGGPDKGPLGSDFDDFILTLTGDFLVEKDAMGAFAKIGATKGHAISVDYQRGTSDCSHAFKFLLRKCPNKESTVAKTYTFSPNVSSAGHFDFTPPAGQYFLDIEMDVGSSTNHQYGGCTVPFPLSNMLYGGGVPALVL